MPDSIKSLVKTLTAFEKGAVLRNYIYYATFPKFKVLEPRTRIDFDFPFTALVGPNGAGKSSVLHALWGMPFGFSTSKFWFATELDPIEGSTKDPQRYFYGHWNDAFNGIVETRKARIGKKRGADYWEPYRSSKADGMQPMPPGDFAGKSKDRWNPVKRSSIYINLKATFGSFDRFFYFDDLTAEAKREKMLSEARRLKSIVELNKQSFRLAGFERVFENRDLSEQELSAVSSILGRKYASARIVRHSLYPGNRGRDTSVVFNRGSKYSEAFAGSGEIAAVELVTRVLAAPDYSLILLDEPETSLHPGAQRALLSFLLSEIKARKHQIVVSTHSPEFLEGLPSNAIKVFEDNGKGLARVLPRSSSSAAFLRLGKLPANKKRILVEDGLGELLIRKAAEGLDPGDAATLEIVVSPGGADAILKYHGPTEMLLQNDTYVMLDGDKRRGEFVDPDTIAPADHGQLGEKLKAQLGCAPMFHIPGGNDAGGHEEAKVQAQLQYLRWVRARVSFLPRKLPEETLLYASDPEYQSPATSKAIKSDFLKLVTEDQDLNLSKGEATTLAKLKVAKLPINNPDLAAIRAILTNWLQQ